MLPTIFDWRVPISFHFSAFRFSVKVWTQLKKFTIDTTEIPTASGLYDSVVEWKSTNSEEKTDLELRRGAPWYFSLLSIVYNTIENFLSGQSEDSEVMRYRHWVQRDLNFWTVFEYCHASTTLNLNCLNTMWYNVCTQTRFFSELCERRRTWASCSKYKFRLAGFAVISSASTISEEEEEKTNFVRV